MLVSLPLAAVWLPHRYDRLDARPLTRLAERLEPDIGVSPTEFVYDHLA